MQKIIVYWRDIPAQVIFKKGRERGKAMLEARFQKAIDRAAMRAGRGGSDAYMADWRRETTTLTVAGELLELARSEVAVLENQYDSQDLEKLVANFGRAENNV